MVYVQFNSLKVSATKAENGESVVKSGSSLLNKSFKITQVLRLEPDEAKV